MRFRAALVLIWPPGPQGETRHQYCGVHYRSSRENGLFTIQLYCSIKRIGSHTDDWLADLEETGLARLSTRERDKLRAVTLRTLRHNTCVTLHFYVLDESERSVCTRFGHSTERMTKTYVERWATETFDPEFARALLRAIILPAANTGFSGPEHTDGTHPLIHDGTQEGHPLMTEASRYTMNGKTADDLARVGNIVDVSNRRVLCARPLQGGGWLI